MDILINWIEVFPVWLKAISGVVLASKAVTVLTPSKADDAFLNGILKVLNTIALNVGKDKNADA